MLLVYETTEMKTNLVRPHNSKSVKPFRKHKTTVCHIVFCDVTNQYDESDDTLLIKILFPD